METLEITIKKSYAKQVIDDLVAMDAIEMVKKPVTKLDNVAPQPNSKRFSGIISQAEGEQMTNEINKMRTEWERDIS